MRDEFQVKTDTKWPVMIPARYVDDAKAFMARWWPGELKFEEVRREGDLVLFHGDQFAADMLAVWMTGVWHGEARGTREATGLRPPH